MVTYKKKSEVKAIINNKEITLKAADKDNVLKCDNLILSVKQFNREGQVEVCPSISNITNGDIFIDEIEVLNIQFEDISELNFMRFGFNMPGDPVLFGKISQNGFSSSMIPSDDAFSGESEKCFYLTANTLIALNDDCDSNALIIGAGSFNTTEGTITIEADKSEGKIKLKYKMILDGVKLAVGEEKKLDSILIVNAKELNCGLREWAGKVATQEGRRIPEEVPTGWNDWQFYRNEKTQEDVLDSADVVEEFKRAGYPLDYVQIDGGFCLHLSEWSIPKPEFSMGIKELSEKIISKGLKFGLWFAPYIQNVNTEVVKQHPEWLLKNEQGEPVCLGNSNVGESYLIDYTVPGTIKWLKEQIHLFSSEWNVTWIKLDGPNYALYRRGKLSDRSLTIHEMLLKTFNVMREVVGDDVLIEGEGPMGLALGEVELHRVQTDNHPVWYRGNDVRQPYAPCVYGKELSMAFLHNIWWCNHRENVVLRDYPSPFCSAKAYNKNAVEQIFTENELQTQLVSTVMSPAGFLLTDPLKELLKTPNRVNYIHQLLPVWRQPADIVDAFPFDGRYPSIYKTKVTLQHEEYFLLSVFNWNDNTKDFVVPIEKIVDDNEAEYYGFSFFENSVFTFKNAIEIKNVSAHGVKLFALRRKKEVPQLLSTDMHFTQGAVDIDSHLWEVERSCLRIRAKHFYQINKKIFLRVPENWQMVNIKSNAEKIHINDFDRENQVIIFNGSKEKHTDIALFFKNTIDH